MEIEKGWYGPIKETRRERALAFGRKLTQWRLATNPRKTQTQAAAEAGITRSQWSRIERGKCLPERATVSAMVRVVGGDITIANVLTGKSDYFTNSLLHDVHKELGKKGGQSKEKGVEIIENKKFEIAESEKLELKIMKKWKKKKLRDLTNAEFEELQDRPYIYADPAIYQAFSEMVQAVIIDCWKVISGELYDERLNESDVDEVLDHLRATTLFYLYRVKPFTT